MIDRGGVARPAAILIAAAALMTLVACGPGTAPEHAANPVTMAPVEVRTAKAAVSAAGLIAIPGSVEAARSVSIAGRITGIIEHLAVEEGSRVRKGDLLVRLDGQELRSQLEAADSALTVARAHFERIRTLHEKEAATKQELDEALARKLSAEATAAGARTRLRYVEMHAPFDGVIVAKHAAMGDLASPGVALLTLQGSGRMRVASTVTQDQARRLEVGHTIDAVIEGSTPEPCVISILGPAGDTGSRRFLLKCDLADNTTARSGSFARLRVADETAGSSIVAPRAALLQRGGLTALFVVEGGVARMRYIDAGAADGDSIVIRSGLAAGDEIVLNPGSLADGAAVRTTPSGPSR